MKTIVAIVGRPNSGKSTLFNRLIGKRKAIIEDTPGVTRDTNYDIVEWQGHYFTLVDTGGFVSKPGDVFETGIRKRITQILEEADLLLFLVDVNTGITDEDEAFAELLRRSGKKVLVVSTKVDNYSKIHDSNEFYRFGFEDVISISAIHGSGTGDLLDKVIELSGLDKNEEDNKDDSELPKFAIIGRPNVGKSTFINSLLGKESNIVTDIPGTTRDTIHTTYNKFDKEFMLIDTAGLRKKGQVKENIEFYSVMRAIRAIEDADVCFVMIDAKEGLQAQDLNIMSLAIKRRKGVVLLVNKWDIIEKETKTTAEFKTTIYKKTEPFTDYPIVFISALEKQRIFKAIEEGFRVFHNRGLKISTSKLNDVMLKIINNYPPPATRGQLIKIKYITQVKHNPPMIAFFCNFPELIKVPYKRFLENKLRENFDFSGISIGIQFRKK